MPSPRAAETCAVEAPCEAAHHASVSISEWLDIVFRNSKSGGHSLVEVKSVTDCRYVCDAVCKQTASTTGNWVQVDLASIRETIARGGEKADAMGWGPTAHQLADGFTKRCAKPRQILSELCIHPEVCLIELKKEKDAKSQADTDEVDVANLFMCWLSLTVRNRIAAPA